MTVAPQPGPHNPARSTSPRVPGSVRRTTSTDITFPDGIGGRVVAEVRGRDLQTVDSRAAVVLDEIVLGIEVDPWTATVVAVDDPDGTSALDTLVGMPLRSGFGRRLAELLPEDAPRRSLRYSALENLGGAYLVSGYAGLRAGLIPAATEHADLAVSLQADVCIGWAADGPVIDMLRSTGAHAVPIGPPAPALDAEDPLAWHELPPLAPPSVRRRRRTDVHPRTSDRERLDVEHHFRDSYAHDDTEEVMHEYLVVASFDGDGRLTSIDVDARVLPWYECPGAVVSAQRLVGVELDQIAEHVRKNFAGQTTCTHLNSTLRSLADVRSLARDGR